ncbi:hypothetical protein G7D34_003707 [Salmonella enterica]|nr:hypothetical protein [Salmonella enterica]
MSKIAKFIKSALNNSSANEAAQALKMAAATMQKEGLNPAEFLQEKGVDNSAELEEAINHAAYYESEWLKLKIELEAAKKGGNPAELREAKELAIKWHRIAQAQEAHLKELAPIAVKAQEQVTSLKADLLDAKQNIFKAIAVCGLVMLCGCWVAYSSGEDAGRIKGYDAGKFAGITQTEKAAPKTNRFDEFDNVDCKKDESKCVTVSLPNSNAVKPTDEGKAICTAQKRNNGVKMRFTYDNTHTNKVNVFVNGPKSNFKWVDITADAIKNADPLPSYYPRSQFLNDVNKEFPANMDCKLY